MKIFQWFKTMTFEGKIKKEISSISADNGKLQVQLLDKKINGEDAYRINLTRTSVASIQSLPIVLSSSQIRELTNSIFRELEHNDTSS